MILGYTIDGADNGYSMYENIRLKECDIYSNVYDINLIDPAIKIRCVKDISSTYDGLVIVSERFKKFCLDENYHGLEFILLPKSPGLFWFKVNNIIKFDKEARKTRFLNYNIECDGYKEIIGANPACIKNKIIEDGFFRSDIFFGSNEGKSPLYFIGKKTKEKLETAKIKDINFGIILDEYKWQREGKDPQ